MLGCSCNHDVQEGVFTPLGVTVTASASAGSQGDDARAESSDGGSSDEGSTSVAPSSDGSTSNVTTADPTNASTDPTNDPTTDPTNDPTVDPGESSGADPTLDPTTDTGVDPTGGDAQACCTAQLVPGCTDATLEACVCGLDDYCCSVEWDDVCVTEAGDCGAACVGGGGDGADCCIANLGLGCSDATIEACVCGIDDYCCSVEWDDVCAGEAIDCGAAC
ncbi:MAG: hypothetical protein K1X88_06510 [Nannocystaceae bacterium]|nr:hypothetical protein [Nannocystaceae bacterium]